MSKEKRAVKKLEKKQEKARLKHRKKIQNGLDGCMIAACFVTFLAAAVLEYLRKDAKKND